MYRHSWMYIGRVLGFIEGYNLEVSLDLGFDVWKNVVVRLNRIHIAIAGLTRVAEFIETSLFKKEVIFIVYKKKDKFHHDKFFVEIYAKPSDLNLALKDINLTISNNHRLADLVNINDILVFKGMAENIENVNFNAKRTDAEPAQ